MANEYAGSPALFLEYSVDEAPASRYGRWWTAYTGGGTVYLPLAMVDSGNQISNGYVDFYNVYKGMVDTALARPAKAELASYVLRRGSKVRFSVRLTNRSGGALSAAANSAAVHAIVYEDAHVADTNRFVRSAVIADVAASLANGASASFTLETPDLAGVNWDKLHFVALADYRPAGATGPYDTLQGTVAGRADIARQEFDGDGKTETAVYRPANGTWFSLPSTIPGSFLATQWGLPADLPVGGDYDGDGKTDAAVWRPGNGMWYALPSGSPGTYTEKQWGLSTDLPLPGDYDGDYKADIAVWRPENGIWYIVPSSSPSTFTSTQWGMQGDVPVPADYDGDGKTDIAVWRPGNGMWYVLPSASPGSFSSVAWGQQADVPVPADYDGDGKTDLAVWRPGNGIWYALSSKVAGNYSSTQWGMNTDQAVPGDYDGDGKADVAVWRPGNGIWYAIPSSAPATYTSIQWGMSGDAPISSIGPIVRAIP